MQAQPDSGGAASYQFVFAGLPENVEYYVSAGPLVSPHYKVRVVDLPSVKGIRGDVSVSEVDRDEARYRRTLWRPARHRRD